MDSEIFEKDRGPGPFFIQQVTLLILLVLQMLILLVIKLTERVLLDWPISLDLHLFHGELRNRIL